MVPRAVLMKSGLVSINTARQNIFKTTVLVNTARQVNAAHSKTTMNAARPMSYLSKTTHSTVKSPINNNTAFKNSNINQRVNTVRGKNVNTARPKEVVNAVKGNNVNAVKASTCWGNPQIDLQDKGVINSGCSRYVTGNMSYLTDYKEIDGGYVAFEKNPKGGKITKKKNKEKFKAKTVNGEVQLHALVDGKKIIVTESTVIRDLQLEDDEGVDCLPNSNIFEQLTLMGSKTIAWNEFSSTMASAIIVKTASTPMKTQKPLLKDEDGEEVDVHMYRSMIGSLMYLTSSRPDIMFAVCACARYQVNPKVSHLHAVKRIFRLISWQCKKQTMVANSTIEAEYVATSSCCGQVLWIQNQLLDYGYNFMHTKIFIDNNKKAKKSVRLMMEKLFGMELELILFGSTVMDKTINGEVQLHALVDGKKIIITESTVRRDLQLEDAEGIDCLPNSTIFEELTRMCSKTTAWNEFSSTMASAIICLATNQKFNFSKYIFESMVPQPSSPTEIVVDEVVHKELGDRLVKVATTASSLEAEQDSGGPRFQETMGDTITQTRFENVSKHSNDSLFTRGNTLRSDEDSLKLKELMELCTNLQQMVLDLEKTKTIGMSRRVESSGDEEDLGEDAFKQERRINAINADKDITLEVFVAEQEVANEKDDDGEITLAQALIEMKSIKPKVKGVVIQEPGESTTTKSSQLSSQQSQDKGKGIMIKEPVKPMKKKVQIMPDEEVAKRLQAEFDEEERLARGKDEANVALTEEWYEANDKGKGIMIEEPVKPMKKKVQIMLDKEATKRLKAKFDEEER
ncbi:hypothetical protein Tco_0291128, partial [Tanacetum coccineum]